jgi:hypothetical protein
VITLFCTGRGEHRRMEHYYLVEADGVLTLYVRPRKGRPDGARASGMVGSGGDPFEFLRRNQATPTYAPAYAPAFNRTVSCTVPDCLRSKGTEVGDAKLRRLYDGLAAAGRKEADISYLPF